MLKLYALLTVVIGICLSAIVMATPLLDVYLPDREAYDHLLTGNFDIIKIEADFAEVVGWEEDVQKLESFGLSYRTIIPDLEAYYQSRLDYELDEMGGYPTFSEIQEWAADFIATYPEITSEIETVGVSLEDRPLWVFKISDNPDIDEDEPEIFINATIHAREVILPLVVMNFCEHLGENYGINERITELVDSREIWIMPVVNPDGYVYNEERNPNGGGMWRKNKRRVNNVIRGVDLNRNFSYMWGYDDEGSSPNPRDETYRGESAASEPETQAVINFVNSRQFVTSMNYHSYGNLLLYPYSYNPTAVTEHPYIYERLASYINETLGWPHGTPPELLYPVNGDAGDWQEGGANIRNFALSFEVGGNNDGFWPPTNRIPFLVQQQEEPLLRLCEMGGNPFIFYPPQTPMIALEDTVSGVFTVSWITPPDEYGNDPIAYDIMEITEVHLDDDAEREVDFWEFDGFERSAARAFDGNFSYYGGYGGNMYNVMTAQLEYTVQEGDILELMVWYVIEENWDYAYVQASFNNGQFINLAGNRTTNYNPHDRNHGNGITGNSGGWITATFPLEDHGGAQMRLRLSYVTDTNVLGEGFYADAISPITAYNDAMLLEEEYADDFLVLDRTIEEGELELWYTVRGRDEQGDYSHWSALAGTIVVPAVDQLIMNINIAGNRFELVSLYVMPETPAVSDVFASLENLVIVYEDNGSIYIPPIINTIGDVSTGEGYQIYSSSLDQWVVAGTPLDPGQEYVLSANIWNWMGYPFSTPMPAVTALETMQDIIIIIMNDDGRFWIPGMLNTLGNLTPGEGYMIFLEEGITFQYDPGALRDSYASEVQPLITPEDPDICVTGLPYPVIVEFNESVIAMNPTVVELYDGDLLVGRSNVDDPRNLLPIIAWQSAPEQGLPGFTPGHRIQWIIKDDENNPLAVEALDASTAFTYGKGGYTQILLSAPELPTSFTVLNGYPNPFNPSFIVPFTLPASGKVSINIVNLLGQTVFSQNREYETGAHRFQFNSADMASEMAGGLYFVTLEFQNQVHTQKMILLK